jgi:hypothetical protein
MLPCGQFCRLGIGVADINRYQAMPRCRRSALGAVAAGPAIHAIRRIAEIYLRRITFGGLSFPDVEQLNVEDQSGIWRNHATGAASSVSELRRDSQLPFASNFHPCDTFIPAFDHLTGSQ